MKLKTHQATAKRYKITKNKKIIKRVCGQNHFNSRENGNVGRNKKSPLVVSNTLREIVSANLPN